MSKCKPKKLAKLADLESRGVTMLDEEIEGTRRIVISVPYEALRDDVDVQIAFQDLVAIEVSEAA